MTQTAFITSYRLELISRYDWASNPERLAKFMKSVSDTLNGANSWNHDGEAVTAAWRTIGGKGKPSKKALQALPSEFA